MCMCIMESAVETKCASALRVDGGENTTDFMLRHWNAIDIPVVCIASSLPLAFHFRSNVLVNKSITKDAPRSHNRITGKMHRFT